VAINRWEPGPA